LDRIRSISEQLLHRYPEAFSTDFDKNKKALEDVAVIESKQMRNHVAGYIARALRTNEEAEESSDETVTEEKEGEVAEPLKAG
jgi:small subunit ribosomal protein S17e